MASRLEPLTMDSSITVLVIDDEPLIRRALASLLRRRGFVPLSADTGERGILLARTHSPDLVLLNIQLPDRSGWEVQDVLARDPATRDIPIVAITGFPAAVSRLSALQNGFAGFLEKPFRYADLMDSIHSALGADAVAAGRSEAPP
jgi:CheY-like chemotaxis protein